MFGLYIDKPWFMYRYTYTKIESLALSLPIRDFIVESNQQHFYLLISKSQPIWGPPPGLLWSMSQSKSQCIKNLKVNPQQIIKIPVHFFLCMFHADFSIQKTVVQDTLKQVEMQCENRTRACPCCCRNGFCYCFRSLSLMVSFLLLCVSHLQIGRPWQVL